MMVGFGFMEILMLALLSGGSSSTDLVALIPPEHYFKSRDIEISPARAVELANMAPKDAKSQVMQLTALRYLYNESDALKKSPRYDGHRQAIEPIAQGKNAQDPLGFAKEYAQRVLDKLDGNRPGPSKAPPVRDDALAWFPADASIVAAFDFRHAKGNVIGPDPLPGLLKMIPDREKLEMYTFIEKIGNARLDRVAFAMAPDEKNRRKGKIFMRFTGKLNSEWAINSVKQLAGPGFAIKEMKDETGTTIVTGQDADRAPIMALIGNTELLVVGYDGNDEKHDVLLKEVLAVRAKKQPNVLTGVLKDRLKKIPEKAVALFVADLPQDLRRELAREFHPSLEHVTAYIERTQMGFDVQAETTMPNRNDADQLVGKIGGLRKQGIEALKQEMGQPQPPEFPQIPFQAMINLLESLQVSNQGERVTARVLVPDGLVQQMGSMGMMFGIRGRPIAPPPKIKVEDK